MENDKTDNSENFEALEKEIREAVAKGVHTRETVRRLTLNAMNAQHIDLASLQRIVAAIMHGIHDGAEEQIQRVISQTQTAKTQINEAVTGLDSALAGFAQASKLAVEEAASQAKNELTRTHSELESLESLFLDTLHDTASAAQGLVTDIFPDVIRHAKNNGTAVGLQLVETLVTFKHQIASIGHAQLESSATLANATAELIGKVTSGVLSGINEQVKK